MARVPRKREERQYYLSVIRVYGLAISYAVPGAELESTPGRVILGLVSGFAVYIQRGLDRQFVA